MNISVNPHQIVPNPEVQDCPVLALEEEQEFKAIRYANPIAGDTRIMHYALGPITCELCPQRCQNARVLVQAKEIVRLADMGEIEINETPITIGNRLEPIINDDLSPVNSETPPPFVPSQESYQFEPIDQILDDFSILRSSKYKLVVKNGEWPPIILPLGR